MSEFSSRWTSALLDTYPTPPVELVSGEGATVTDADGNTYIDMLAGIAVNALGHAHPAIVDAVSAQVARLGHVSNLLGSQPVVEVAEALRARVGVDTARVCFCNSGAEANEAAFKLARLTGRRRILAAERGFHGRTMGALAMTGQPDKRTPFEPMPGGVEFVPYGDIDFLTKTIESDPLGVAAVILEPIQGETGVVAPPEGYLADVRELTKRFDVLMIVDEVQTGIGRTGQWFAHQHDGIVPDVMTLAKGLGGGLPLGAVIANGRAAELFTPGAHGTTFGGNPVCAAAGLAVIETLEEEKLLDRVTEKGKVLARKLASLNHVDHVRGRGFMLGLVLCENLAKEAVNAGYERGVILNAPQANVLRIVPPLNLSDEEINRAVELIDACLNDAAEAVANNGRN